MSRTIARSMLSAALLPAAMVIIASAAGCAGMPKSGFLSDYSGFEEAPEDAPIWEYLDPDHKRGIGSTPGFGATSETGGTWGTTTVL